MPRHKRGFSLINLLNLLCLWPVYFAVFGLIVAGYGWWQDSTQRVWQGLQLTVPAVLFVVFVLGLLLLSGFLNLLLWAYHKCVSPKP